MHPTQCKKGSNFIESPGSPPESVRGNLPIILAGIVLSCNFVTLLTSFIPIALGSLAIAITYGGKGRNRWLYAGVIAFFAFTGYHLLENGAAHAFFLNNVETFARDTFVATGTDSTQVNTALTVGFGLIRVVALGLVFGGIWQGYNNFRGGQELSAIVMPPASAAGLIVATQAIANMMMTTA